MAFGWPVRYWQLSLNEVSGGASAYDKAVTEASEEYKERVVKIKSFLLIFD